MKVTYAACVMAAVSFFTFPGTLSVHAGRYHEGEDGCGAVLKGESPVAIEREKVSLHIEEFPDPTSDMVCPSYAETQYIFHNPTQNEEPVRLYTPAFVCDYKGCTLTDPAHLSYCKADGEKMEGVLRHTFRTGYALEAEEEVARLCDEKRQSEFFSPEMPVHALSYRLKNGCVDEIDHCTLTLSYNPARTRIYFDNRSGGAREEVENGLLNIAFETAREECIMEIFSIGEEASVLSAKVYSDPDAKIVNESATFECISSRTQTFLEFSNLLRASFGKEVSETDWYNFLLDLLEDRGNGFGAVYVPMEWYSAAHLRTWYEYLLSVPANGRVTAEIGCPLLPAVNESGPTYRYNYLLSPARRFSSVGGLEIELITPFYLGYSTLSFEASDGGYALSREGLPIGELSFTLAPSMSDYQSSNGGGEELSPNMRLAIILLSVIGGGAAIAGVAAIIYARRRRKKH